MQGYPKRRETKRNFLIGCGQACPNICKIAAGDPKLPDRCGGA